MRVGPIGVRTIGAGPSGVGPVRIEPVGIRPTRPIGVPATGIEPVGVRPARPIGIPAAGIGPTGIRPARPIGIPAAGIGPTGIRPVGVGPIAVGPVRIAPVGVSVLLTRGPGCRSPLTGAQTSACLVLKCFLRLCLCQTLRHEFTVDGAAGYHRLGPAIPLVIRQVGSVFAKYTVHIGRWVRCIRRVRRWGRRILCPGGGCAHCADQTHDSDKFQIAKHCPILTSNKERGPSGHARRRHLKNHRPEHSGYR